MARSRFNVSREIVDLSSDSDELLSGDELEFFDAPTERQGVMEDVPGVDGLLEEFDERYHPVYGGEDEIIDLTGMPDIDVPPSDPVWADREVAGPSNASGESRVITEFACLQMILDVLPEISVDHVLTLIRESTTDLTRTAAQCENIITQLLDGEAYPKEADEAKNKKRKRKDEDEWKDYEKAERDPEVVSYESDA
jgi:TRIAD3 protein (E3 ubiquitin-protein ligase RNF216)